MEESKQEFLVSLRTKNPFNTHRNKVYLINSARRILFIDLEYLLIYDLKDASLKLKLRFPFYLSSQKIDGCVFSADWNTMIFTYQFMGLDNSDKI